MTISDPRSILDEAGKMFSFILFAYKVQRGMLKSGAGFDLEHGLDTNLTKPCSNTHFTYPSALFLRRKS